MMRAKSSSEFGKLKLVRLILGNLERKQELDYSQIKSFDDPYQWQKKFAISQLPKKSYLRIEIQTRSEKGKLFKCLTNPIWIDRG